MTVTRIGMTTALALGVWLIAAAAQAQISSLPENQKLIDGYTLTMDNIRKVAVANQMFKATNKKAADEGDNAVEQPLSKQWEKIEKGDTTGILPKVGISARDLMLTLTTVMQTTIDVQLKAKPRTATNAANMEMFKKNQAEIMQAIR